MKKVKDLCVATREYTDKNGNKKTSWLNVGSIMEKDGREFILLNRHFNPAGVPNPDNRDTLLVSMFDAKEKGVDKSGSQGDNPFEDKNIPF